MSLEKGIEHGKEHRKPYYRSGKFDPTCRPNGGCSYCENNRMHKNKKKECACKAQLDDVALLDKTDLEILKFWNDEHDYNSKETETQTEETNRGSEQEPPRPECN